MAARGRSISPNVNRGKDISSKRTSPSPPRAGSPKSILMSIAHNAGQLRPSSPQQLDMSKVKKNSKGGVLVTHEEVAAVFAMLDVEKTGTVSIANLKKRLNIFFPDMTAKDFRFLMNDKKELTLHDLYELLLDNEIANFDPVAEAFRAFDVNNEGIVNEQKLHEAFKAYGYGDLTPEEFGVLIKAADLDGDGSVSLEDFRGLLDTALPPQAKHP